MDLKKQTTISLIWNGFNKIGYQVIALLVGIVTARLLTPTDFGYIAALAVFTMLSATNGTQVLVLCVIPIVGALFCERFFDTSVKLLDKKSLKMILPKI